MIRYLHARAFQKKTIISFNFIFIIVISVICVVPAMMTEHGRSEFLTL